MSSKDHAAYLNDISIARTDDNSVEISLRFKNDFQAVSICRGESPDEISHLAPIIAIKGQTCVRITGLDPGVRYYFELIQDDSHGVIISERRVPLQGSVNFRDLGGYETTDGRRVKWGQLFRSDHLGRLTDRDLAVLRRMRIRQVCDFRTPAEVKKLPDRFPAGDESKYCHLPIQHGEFDPADTFERVKNGDIDWMTEEFMIEGYIRNIENFADLWSKFFRCAADPANRPLVFHCTGGKDRAGVCAALILLALGVSEETVVQDHGRSNFYIAAVLEKIFAEIKSLGIDPEKVSPYFTAPRSAILAVVNHIRTTYGSAVGYLQNKAGVDEKSINRLRDDLLTG
jgi:protein-tyrosine phosphatase